ncbi:MAG TPA: CatB-related O-acetyltransferase, partial [Chitinophagaceae bacterium]|nr:CatB-related O-acetyltransferase [Chitinophagaceae bacterium]
WENAMAGKVYPFKGNTVIGNDVWIGYNATIMAGVTIGDGAIIATNSTVTKDVAPYSIVGGNPVQEIRRRFPDEVVQKLLEIRWWDWDAEKITRNVQYLTGRNIDQLINAQ